MVSNVNSSLPVSGLIGSAAGNNTSTRAKTTQAAQKSLPKDHASSSLKIATVSSYTLDEIRKQLAPLAVKETPDNFSYTISPWDKVRKLLFVSHKLHSDVMQKLCDKHDFVVNIGAGGSIQYPDELLRQIVMTQPNRVEAQFLKSLNKNETVYVAGVIEIVKALLIQKNKTVPCFTAINVFDYFSKNDELNCSLEALAKVQGQGDSLVVISDTNPAFGPTIDRIKQKLIQTEKKLDHYFYPIAIGPRLATLKLNKESIKKFDKDLFLQLSIINQNSTLMMQALENAEKGKINDQPDPIFKKISEFLGKLRNPPECIYLHEYYFKEMSDYLRDLGYQVEIEQQITWGTQDRESYQTLTNEIFGVSLDTTTFDIAGGFQGIGDTVNFRNFKASSPDMSKYENDMKMKIFPENFKELENVENIQIGFGATILNAVKK